MLEFLAVGDTIVPAADEPGESAARVGQHDFEPGKGIQHAAEDQIRSRDRGFMGIADQVAQVIVAHALDAARVYRVQAQRETLRLAFRIDRPEGLVVEVPAVDVHRHVHAADARQSRRALEFLDGEFGRLHGQRHRAAEALRVLRIGSGARIIVRPREPHAEFGRRPVDHGVGEREEAHIYACLIHGLHHIVEVHHVRREGGHERYTRDGDRAPAFFVLADFRAIGAGFALEQLHPFGREPVRVYVDCLHVFSSLKTGTGGWGLGAGN